MTTKADAKTETPADVANRLVEKTNTLVRKEQELLKKRNRRDYLLFGLMTAMYIVLAIWSFSVGKINLAMFASALSVWILYTLMLNLQINEQQHIIHMMSGLREIENEEFDIFMAEKKKNKNPKPPMRQDVKKEK